MRNFQVYYKWEEKLYAYDRAANAILSRKSGIWSVEIFLQEELYGQRFTTLCVDHGNLYLYGRMTRYIVRMCLADKLVQVIALPIAWEDEKGAFFSNIIWEKDGMILLPFWGGQVHCLDYYGNVLKKDWQEGFDGTLENLRKGYGLAQIRRWGAYIRNSRMYMVIAGSRADRLLLYDICRQQAEAIPIGNYEKLFYLESFSDRLYVQGSHDSGISIAELDFDGNVLRDVRIEAGEKKRHAQWMDSGKCIVIDKDTLIIVETDFSIQKIPLLSDDVKLEVIDNNLFTSPEGIVYHYDARYNRFCKCTGREETDELLMASAEYRKSVIFYMKRQVEGGLIAVERGVSELGIFIEMPLLHLNGSETQSHIGESIWRYFC